VAFPLPLTTTVACPEMIKTICLFAALKLDALFKYVVGIANRHLASSQVIR
jgi:hypothetical protein